MKVLWAPWRYSYVKRATEGKEEGCVLCRLQGMNDEDALIIFRGRHNYIVMNLYPYNTGHVMIVPKRHVANLEDLTIEEKLELIVLTQASIQGIREALNPHGFNVGINLGRVAGAGIEDHIHVHVVPRWNGDTNFMPVIAETKVIPQDVRETYRVIRDPIARYAEKLLKELQDYRESS
ncbi:histidine triad (HIT) protein [Pyrolobus fumarii 1A]|uniref:Histidine triad (HIT) protein n=1 Tax=Pyrolobus fumarii (strain DSM 11204 / 1A) TaxID=694429 RepID=G0EEL7_PYRF1|nr:HIT domain-containing protein [Pyrolobus fumarii]AEM38839.1 histidine triad (HIT) protein [Pyrolobus fumarii 1A]